MTLGEFELKLGDALRLELPYSERPPVLNGTPAAVLILFGCSPDAEVSMLMTRRTEKVVTHKGQMAFPGGHSEPDEAGSEAGLQRTALRETEEEVGIPAESIRVHGRLPGLWTPTGFWITPIVGTLSVPVSETPLRPDPHEIAEAFWIPLSRLRDPGTYRRELMRVGSVSYPIHVYQVGGDRIWGATGAMIKNLLDRLERVR